MRAQRFRARVTADHRGHARIAMPFDPDEAWGVKAVHHVNGTLNGYRVRVTIAPVDGGWAVTLNPARMRGIGIAIGSEVPVELTPEGPQRGDLAEDISAALAANPAAGAFFDTLAQFYRKAYLRYIDATTRRPDRVGRWNQGEVANRPAAGPVITCAHASKSGPRAPLRQERPGARTGKAAAARARQTPVPKGGTSTTGPTACGSRLHVRRREEANGLPRVTASPKPCARRPLASGHLTVVVVRVVLPVLEAF
jgi:Bacteriocin-protection, YdeI or OmpD-Associated/Domain of unknown function (DUF1905)